MNRRPSLSVLYGLCVVVGLAGCADPPAENNENVRSNYYDVPNAYVYEFNLKDSTRCVYIVALTAHGASITCDWQHPHSTETPE